MTREQAAAALAKAYPGKRHYLCAMQWAYEDGTSRPTDFSVCVYDVGGENISGSGNTLANAVQDAIAKHPAKKDADAMFAEPAKLELAPA